LGDDRERGSEEGGAPQAPRGGDAARRGRILVVDDDPMIGKLLERALAPDHDVVFLRSARQALGRLAAGERFDVVLCDLMMPEMTGMDLHAELARLDPGTAATMVFLTGGAYTPLAQTFLARVPNARVDKPFDFQQVRALIDERLRRR
jgi:CheY-like chemotaxis protein